MGDAARDVTPLAVGVALSPLPILAFLLMLLSEREVANARAFLAGWVITLASVATLAALVGLDLRSANPPTVIRIAEVASGLALIAAAVVTWRRRTATAPRWLHAVDAISPGRASVLAAALVVLNAKDLTLTVAAGSLVADAAIDTAAGAATVAWFTALASTTIAIPFAVAVFAGPRAEPTLRRWHGWFERNGTTVVAVVTAAVGLLFVGAGLR
jgi:hypothetical protein